MTEIRPARPADGDMLRTIQQRSLAEPWPELLDTAINGPLPLFVVVDEQPIGYALVLTNGVAYMPELAIHPDRQREGHGSALLSFLCDHLADSGHTEIRLTVRASDDGARQFYAAHGFEQIERVENHFENCDGLLLARSSIAAI